MPFSVKITLGTEEAPKEMYDHLLFYSTDESGNIKKLISADPFDKDNDGLSILYDGCVETDTGKYVKYGEKPSPDVLKNGRHFYLVRKNSGESKLQNTQIKLAYIKS